MSELKVIVYNDNVIGIVVGEECGLFTPQVAIEIAQSLILSAKEADPMIDVKGIIKNYHDSRGISAEVH